MAMNDAERSQIYGDLFVASPGKYDAGRPSFDDLSSVAGRMVRDELSPAEEEAARLGGDRLDYRARMFLSCYYAHAFGEPLDKVHSNLGSYVQSFHGENLAPVAAMKRVLGSEGQPGAVNAEPAAAGASAPAKKDGTDWESIGVAAGEAVGKMVAPGFFLSRDLVAPVLDKSLSGFVGGGKDQAAKDEAATGNWVASSRNGTWWNDAARSVIGGAAQSVVAGEAMGLRLAGWRETAGELEGYLSAFARANGPTEEQSKSLRAVSGKWSQLALPETYTYNVCGAVGSSLPFAVGSMGAMAALRGVTMSPLMLRILPGAFGGVMEGATEAGSMGQQFTDQRREYQLLLDSVAELPEQQRDTVLRNAVGMTHRDVKEAVDNLVDDDYRQRFIMASLRRNLVLNTVLGALEFGAGGKAVGDWVSGSKARAVFSALLGGYSEVEQEQYQNTVQDRVMDAASKNMAVRLAMLDLLPVRTAMGLAGYDPEARDTAIACLGICGRSTAISMWDGLARARTLEQQVQFWKRNLAELDKRAQAGDVNAKALLDVLQTDKTGIAAVNHYTRVLWERAKEAARLAQQKAEQARNGAGVADVSPDDIQENDVSREFTRIADDLEKETERSHAAEGAGESGDGSGDVAEPVTPKVSPEVALREVQSVVDRLAEAFPDAAPVQVISEASLSDSLRALVKSGKQVNGWYSSKDGRVYLVAESLMAGGPGKAAAEKVVKAWISQAVLAKWAHEQTHHGADLLFGHDKAGADAFLVDLYHSLPVEQTAGLLSKIGMSAGAVAANPVRAFSKVAEEYLVRLVEKKVSGGNLNAAQTSAWARVKTFFRDGLVKFARNAGFSIAYTDSEIERLALSMYRAGVGRPAAPKQRTAPSVVEMLKRAGPVLNAIHDNGGILSSSLIRHDGGEYNGRPTATEVAPFGAAIYANASKVDALSPDLMAEALVAAGLLRDPTPDELWKAVRREVEAFRKEGKASKEEEAAYLREARFHDDAMRPGKGARTMSVNDLGIRNGILVQGEWLRVEHIEADGGAENPDVTLVGGARYGTIVVPGGSIIYIDDWTDRAPESKPAGKAPTFAPLPPPGVTGNGGGQGAFVVPSDKTYGKPLPKAKSVAASAETGTEYQVPVEDWIGEGDLLAAEPSATAKLLYAIEHGVFDSVPAVDWDKREIAWARNVLRNYTIPSFQGGKDSVAADQLLWFDKVFSPRACAAVETLVEGFGGTGCYGMMFATFRLMNLKRLIICEIDQDRAAKIQYSHSRGSHFLEDFDAMGVGPVLNALMAEGTEKQKAVERAQGAGLDLGEVEKEKAKDTWSASSLSRRLSEALEARDPRVRDIAEKPNGMAVLKALIDAGNNSMGWSAIHAAGTSKDDKNRPRVGADGHSDLVVRLAKQLADAERQAQALIARGVEVIYKPGFDTLKNYRELPQGDRVLWVADPPYYHTSGYSNCPYVTAGKWNAAGYQAVADFLLDLKGLQSSVLYNDEAWWFRDDAQGRKEKGAQLPDIARAINVFLQVRSAMGEMHTFHNGVAGRDETVGGFNQLNTEAQSNGSVEQQRKPEAVLRGVGEEERTGERGGSAGDVQVGARAAGGAAGVEGRGAGPVQEGPVAGASADGGQPGVGGAGLEAGMVVGGGAGAAGGSGRAAGLAGAAGVGAEGDLDEIPFSIDDIVGDGSVVPRVLYHGTSGAEFKAFGGDLAFFTADPREAAAYALNDIIGGSRGKGRRRVVRVEVEPWETRDISREVDASIMEEEGTLDLDATLEREAAATRAAGQRWMTFLHPGVFSDEMRVYVSLFPGEDVKIVADRDAGGDVHFSIDDIPGSDAAYLAAVDRGDTATAQRLVDEAAQAAGYIVSAWHGGRDALFTVFDKAKRRDFADAKHAFFFAETKVMADHFSWKNGERVAGGTRRFFLRLGDANIVAGRGAVHGGTVDSHQLTSVNLKLAEAALSKALSEGKAGVAWEASDLYGDQGFSYAVFEPEDIKSADAVTRDDAGRVIPLSQRFDLGSDDIRYSIEDAPLPQIGYAENLLSMLVARRILQGNPVGERYIRNRLAELHADPTQAGAVMLAGKIKANQMRAEREAPKNDQEILDALVQDHLKQQYASRVGEGVEVGAAQENAMMAAWKALENIKVKRRDAYLAKLRGLSDSELEKAGVPNLVDGMKHVVSDFVPAEGKAVRKGRDEVARKKEPAGVESKDGDLDEIANVDAIEHAAEAAAFAPIPRVLPADPVEIAKLKELIASECANKLQAGGWKISNPNWDIALRKEIASTWARLIRDAAYAHIPAGPRREWIVVAASDLAARPGLVSAINRRVSQLAYWVSRAAVDVDRGKVMRLLDKLLALKAVKSVTDSRSELIKRKLEPAVKAHLLLAKDVIAISEKKASALRSQIDAVGVKFASGELDGDEVLAALASMFPSVARESWWADVEPGDAIDDCKVALAKYGAIEDRTPAEMAEALAQLKRDYNGGIEAILNRRIERAARLEPKQQALADGFRAIPEGDRRGLPEKLERWWRGSFGWFNGLTDLLRFDKSPNHAVAVGIAKDFSLAAQAAHDGQVRYVSRAMSELGAAVKRIYGGDAERVIRELRQPQERYRKFSHNEVRQRPLSKANLIAIVAMLEQRDYSEKRPAAYLADVMRELSPRDLQLLDWLRGWYERSRPELSAKSVEVLGVPVVSPDPLYHPARVAREGEGFLEIHYGLQLAPETFAKRQAHKWDIDETADVFDMFHTYSESNARFLNYVDLAQDLRFVFGHPKMRNVIKSVLGGAAAQSVLKHVTEIAAGRAMRTDSGGADLLATARAATTLAVMSGNVGAALRQFAAVPAFLLGMDGPRDFARSLAAMVTRPADWLSAWNDIRKDPAFIHWARIGWSEPAENAMRAEFENLALRKVSDVAKLGMRVQTIGIVGSVMLVAPGFYLLRRDAYLRNGMDMAAASARAKNETMWLVHHTQGSGQTQVMSPHWLAGSEFVRGIMQFQGPITTLLSWEQAAFREAWAGTPGGRRKLLNVMVANHILGPAIYEGAKALWTALLGGFQDDPDDEWAKLGQEYLAMALLGPLSGYLIIGGALENWCRLAAGGRNLSDGIPLVSQFNKVGGDVATLVRHAVTDFDLGQAVDDTVKVIGDVSAPVRDARKAVKNWLE